MKRGLAVAVVLVAVAAAAGLGWMAGQRVRSPDQIAFETQPPEPSLITVEVELTELAADVITRADVGYDDPAALSLSGALGGQPSVLLVTSAPERGDDLAEGSAAIEISGRPVFLLVGEIPVFRDLRPKAKGPDVRQLEEALARLGYFDLTPDDTWDPDTGAAAAAWYEAAGYAPNGVSEDEERRLETARDRVKTATNGVDTAADRVRTAQNGVKTAEDAIETAARNRTAAENTLARARRTLADAQADLADARKGADEIDIRRARSTAASAREQLDFARADGRQSAAEAERTILAAEETREQAARDYTAAQARWQSAQDGVHPDGGTAPTPSQMESLRLAYEQAGDALDAAERGIDEARASKDRKAVQSAAAVRSAEDGLAAAQKALDDLLAPPDTTAQSRAVDSARSGLESAQSGVEDAVRGAEDAQTGLEDAASGVEDAQTGLEDARAELADAEADLAKLESETGIWIPAGELIFLERLPVRVDRLTAERGSTVSGSFMTVTGSELAARGSVLVRDVSLVREGQEARIDDPLLVEPLAGEIRLVADRAGTRNVANDRHYLEITAEGIPDELIGANVKVVIPVGGTDGEVLAVPAAALSATADGSTRVEVEQPDGSTRFVVVDPGLAASGLVEVTPLDGELQEGDLVVVGAASGE